MKVLVCVCLDRSGNDLPGGGMQLGLVVYLYLKSFIGAKPAKAQGWGKLGN